MFWFFTHVSTKFLVQLNRFKEGLEISFSKSLGIAMPLDEFKEKCRAVTNRAGEELEQITVFFFVA